MEGVDLSADEHVHAKLAQAKGDLQVGLTGPPLSDCGPCRGIGASDLELLKYGGLHSQGSLMIERASDSSRIQGHVHLQYVVNYPKGEKYVSLLRNAEDPEAQKVLEAERKRIRAKVRQHLADIAMITQPNEGIPQLRKQPTQPQASPSPDQVSMQLYYPGQERQTARVSCLGKAHASRQWGSHFAHFAGWWRTCSTSAVVWASGRRRRMLDNSLLTILIMQDMPNPDEAKPRAQALTKAALRTPASKQKALSADQHEQPPLKGSSVLSALAGQTIAASAAPPSEPGRQSAGAPVASSRQQGGGLAGGDAEPDDIEEDDFFMSSSADEAVQVKQPAHLSQPSDLPAILPQERISSEQQHLASASMMHHHSKHRKGIQHSRKLPPGQRRADQGLKIHAKLAVPSVPKAMKQVHKKRSTARQAAPGKLTVTARGQPCRGQPDGRAPSATADKPSPGAAPDKRQGQPLRTRADGGRKRRKKP